MVFVKFALLLLAVTGGGALLSEGAESVAEKYGVNFAGSILLALVTTIPEYLFVIFAVQRHNAPEVGLGSAIGACTLLITLGYGSVILFATSRLSRNPVEVVRLSPHTRKDGFFLIFAALTALALALIGDNLSTVDGVILAVVFAAYVLEHARYAYRTAAKNSDGVTRRQMWQAAGFFVAGGVVILLVSDPFVGSMIDVAHAVHISPMTIAIVLSPLASEMPEKITAYLTVVRDGELAEISIANFIGSEVNHNTLLLAVLAFMYAAGGHGAVRHIVTAPFLLMIGLTVIGGMNLRRRRLTRSTGWFFLTMYAVILAVAFHTGARLPGG